MPVQEAMVLAIIEMIIRYGPKAVIAIAELWEIDDKPTVEQIKALKIVKDPEDYFQ